MEKNVVLLILPIIFGMTYGNVLRPDYILNEGAGGWLKFHRLPKIWEQAHLTCLNEGAVLASPLNGDLKQAIRSLMIEHGVAKTPVFTGMVSFFSNSRQKHVEGIPDSQTFTHTLESCTGLSANGTKVELSCFEHHPFACFMKKQDTELTECGTSDTEYVLDNRTGSCYKVYQDGHNFDDASSICQAQGGHLAIINSQAEAEVIWELAKESTSIYALFLGFRADNDVEYYRNRTWTTVQGQSLEEAGYDRWFAGEPNSMNENCGSVIFRGSKEDGILNDVTCSMDLMFICEIEPNASTRLESQALTWVNSAITDDYESTSITSQSDDYESTTPVMDDFYESTTSVEPKSTSTTPDRFICNAVPQCDTLDPEYIINLRTGSCYKMHQVRRDWESAYNVCRSEGGHLAVVNSQEEAEVIWDLAKYNEYSTFIGYRAFGEPRIWITVQGQTLADAGYDNWNWGEPSIPEAGEKCGGLNGGTDHGILNDVWCYKELNFICEIEPRVSTFITAQYW